MKVRILCVATTTGRRGRGGFQESALNVRKWPSGYGARPRQLFVTRGVLTGLRKLPGFITRRYPIVRHRAWRDPLFPLVPCATVALVADKQYVVQNGCATHTISCFVLDTKRAASSLSKNRNARACTHHAFWDQQPLSDLTPR